MSNGTGKRKLHTRLDLRKIEITKTKLQRMQLVIYQAIETLSNVSSLKESGESL